MKGLSFLQHLECSLCGRVHPADRLQTLCACGGPLLARYDLGAVGRAVDPDRLAARPAGMWRYRELLPVGRDDCVVTLGEGGTPLVRCDRLGERLGLGRLYIKDESRNPTGTFKDRGASCAASRLRELGARAAVLATAGNAGAAWAAYAARAGLELHVFAPSDAPATTIAECRIRGARVRLVEGLISDAGARAAALAVERGWFDASTFKEPYRVEGKKTLGLEIAEQLGWRLPDAVVYPTGGGVGLVGMGKAFEELVELGWVRGPAAAASALGAAAGAAALPGAAAGAAVAATAPPTARAAGGAAPSRGPAAPPVRMMAVQAEGCAPIVQAFEAGRDRAEPWPQARTVAAGIRVPRPLADALILRALRHSGGAAVAVSDAELLEAVGLCARLEGLLLCPEGGAALAGLGRLAARGVLGPGDTVILLNTGTGLKHLELVAGLGGEGACEGACEGAGRLGRVDAPPAGRGTGRD